MSVYEAAMKRRSIRSFLKTPIKKESLQRMMEAARMAPTGVNRQPLCFAAVNSPVLCKEIFPQTRWAGLLPKPLGKPQPGHEPAAYILILVDKTVAPDPTKVKTDVGAAGMSIILTAMEEKISSCWIGSVNRSGVAQTLNIDLDRYEIDSLIALGYADMKATATDMSKGSDDTAYFIDENGIFTVPKRNPDTVCKYIG